MSAPTRRRLSDHVGEAIEAVVVTALADDPDDLVERAAYREALARWADGAVERVVFTFDVDRDGRGHVKPNSLFVVAWYRTSDDELVRLSGPHRVRHLVDDQGRPLEATEEARRQLGALYGMKLPAVPDDLAGLADIDPNTAPREDTPDDD